MRDEEGLVRLARKGDSDAFAQLVRLHEKRVYTLALRMAGNPSDAEEIAQEAFLAAWRGLPAFRMDSSFSTWVYRLTSNACIDFLRRGKKRAADVPLCGDGWDFTLPDDAPGPYEAAERRELREAIRRGMEALSPEQRQILALREFQGLSYEEIGAVLELEQGTVKSRIARARLRLREVLTAEGNLFPVRSSKKT